MNTKRPSLTARICLTIKVIGSIQKPYNNSCIFALYHLLKSEFKSSFSCTRKVLIITRLQKHFSRLQVQLITFPIITNTLNVNKYTIIIGSVTLKVIHWKVLFRYLKYCWIFNRWLSYIYIVPDTINVNQDLSTWTVTVMFSPTMISTFKFESVFAYTELGGSEISGVVWIIIIYFKDWIFTCSPGFNFKYCSTTRICSVLNPPLFQL